MGLQQSDFGGNGQLEGGLDGSASQCKLMAPLAMHEMAEISVAGFLTVLHLFGPAAKGKSQLSDSSREQVKVGSFDVRTHA